MEVHCQLEQTSLATTQQQLSRVQYVMTGVKVSLIGDSGNQTRMVALTVVLQISYQH